MQQTEVSIHSSTALRQTMKNRFLSPVTGVFRKRFLTTCLTTDSRGVCGNSVVKSCEEHPQQSKSGYKAPEKVEKLLFKSLGPGDRAFEPHYSDQPPLKSWISEGVSYSLPIAAPRRADLTVIPEGAKRRLTCT